MFYQIFLSPQVKQCAIITYKHKLAHQLPNKLTLRKYQESMKPHRIIAQRPVPPPKENRHQHQQKSPQNRNQPPPLPENQSQPQIPRERPQATPQNAKEVTLSSPNHQLQSWAKDSRQTLVSM